MKKIILSLIAFLIAGPVMAGGGGGGGDNRNSCDGDELWSDAYGGSVGCNCDKDADFIHATGAMVFGTIYPVVGKCDTKEDGYGIWNKGEGLCSGTQPNTIPTGMTAEHAGVGNCWELFCADRSKFVVGTIGTGGTRDATTIQWNAGCQPCPAGEVLKTNITANKISFSIENNKS